MELKVWVDGIQRVVCGANLSTTCQDVVVALAHAMGRTGRFTLIEKWRDAERPLTPGECPLQSLHKWGEYAPEVRFYLMQSEPDKPQQKTQKQQSAQPSEMEVGFSHNFTPPVVKPRNLSSQTAQSQADSVKRSSTFSGVHNSNSYSIPASSSSSLHAKIDLLKQQQQQQQQPQLPSSGRLNRSHPLPTIQQHKHNSLPPQSRPAVNQSNRTSHYNNPDPSQHYQQQQPYQNLHVTSSQNSRGQTNTRTQPIPTYPHRLNGHLSPGSPSSSANSSPREARLQPHSPGRGLDPSTSPSRGLDPSTSPGRDSRYLHPANIPRPADSYSNHTATVAPSSRSRSRTPREDVRQTSKSPHRTGHPGSSSTSKPVPVPRSQHRRSSSPSSHPYENLPPRRVQHDSSSSSTHPSNSPRDVQPPRHREKSRERSSRSTIARIYPMPSNHLQDSNRRGERHRRKSSERQYQQYGFTISNRDQINLNSDLSDDCFHPADPYSKSPIASNGVYLNDINTMKPPNSKHLPVQIKSLPHKPQFSQTLPRYATTNAGRPSDANPETTKSQSLPSKDVSPPQRVRRSDGYKVNFVESALMRQQRTSMDNNNANNRNSHQPVGIPPQGGEQTMPGGQPSMDNYSYSISNHPASSPSNKPSNLPYTTSGFPEGNGYHPQPRSGSARNPQSPNPPALNMSHSSSSSDYHPQNQQQQQQQHRQQHPNAQHTSAFKVVPPRSNSITPTNSPLAIAASPKDVPIPYSLDHQNFDLPVNAGHPPPSFPESTSLPIHHLQPQPHSRQASLEIEEYDLDQNFPDVHHKDHQPSTLPRAASRKSTDGAVPGKDSSSHPTTEYVLDRPRSSAVDPEYMRMLRQVKLQQERLKLVDSQVSEMEAEISTLETDQSNLDLQLDVVATEICSMEKAEEQNQGELVELDRVEWVNVLDGETKCETDLRLQMSKLQGELDKVEQKLEQLQQEEQEAAAQLESERKAKEEQQREEESRTQEQLVESKGQLQQLDKQLSQGQETVTSLEAEIAEALDRLKAQEKEAERIESLLRQSDKANVKETSKPSSTISVSSTDVLQVAPPQLGPASPGPNSPPSRPPSETGEAILKILEGKLSPRHSPSPTTNDEGLVLSQSSFKSPTAVKNPNGVWV